jgi:hypothetical protein
MIDFKLNKLTSSFTNLESPDKLKLVNTIVQTYLWAFGNPTYLTENDKVNLDDIMIVAAELLYEVNIYEWSVLNPINFILISMLELALTKSPNNNSLKVWLMKILGKLGLASRFTQIGHSVKGLSDNSFESFGALKYGIFQTFCVEKELEQNIQKYEKFYSETLAKNKSAIVSGFATRDF